LSEATLKTNYISPVCHRLVFRRE